MTDDRDHRRARIDELTDAEVAEALE
jgi:hypothetical protein